MYKREASDGSTAERRGRGAFERHRSSRKSPPKEEKKQESVSRITEMPEGEDYSARTQSGGYDDMAAFGSTGAEGRFQSFSDNAQAEFRPMSPYGGVPSEYRPPMAYDWEAEPLRRPSRAAAPAELRRPIPPIQPTQQMSSVQPAPAAAASGADSVPKMYRGSMVMASQNSIFWPMLCWVMAVAVVAVVLPRLSLFSRVIEIEEQPSAADIVVQESSDLFIASGDEGAVVTVLQKALHQLGYLAFDDISGIYDAKTHEAVNLALASQGIIEAEGCSEDSHSRIIEMLRNVPAEQPEGSQP